jgi:gamma-glutamyltranspeptidase/glutathione hydrolase
VKKSSISAVLAALLWCAAPISASAQAQAQAPEPQPIISGWARALPSLSRNGMVVSQERTASQVGLDILKAGGNAVDAAVAVGFALAVTLPRAGNIGGGGFMLVHLAGSAKTVAIDYRETAPASTSRDVFLDENGAYSAQKAQ